MLYKTYRMVLLIETWSRRFKLKHHWNPARDKVEQGSLSLIRREASEASEGQFGLVHWLISRNSRIILLLLFYTTG